MRLLVLFILSTILSTAVAAPTSVTREQAVEQFKLLKEQNTRRLQEIEARIQQLMAPKTLSVSALEGEISRLATDRKDLLMRQHLWDRLLFQVDTRFKSGTDLREFLSVRLAEMARVELLNGDSQQGLWKQMSYLSQALRELPERGDNIIAFVDGYVSRSSFREPIKPEDYQRSRQYSNGRETFTANGSSKAEVGELVEKKLEALEAPKAEGEQLP